MYKLIIAGGREFNDKARMLEALKEMEAFGTFSDGIEIVSGMARGADKLGYKIARENSISIKEFPANWDKHGKGAGYLRNKEMAVYADGLLAFWDGESKGTKHMIDTMKGLNKGVHIVRY